MLSLVYTTVSQGVVGGTSPPPPNRGTRTPHGSSAGQKHGAPGAAVAGEISGLEEAQQVQYARGEKGDTLVNLCDVPLWLQGAVSSCMKHLFGSVSAQELAGEG